MSKENIDEIGQWLKVDVPLVVSNLEAFDKTKHAQRVVEYLRKK
jgi:hypothetical protein